MTPLPPLPLHMLGVWDRGVPNRERIVLRADAFLDITRLFVAPAVRGEDGGYRLGRPFAVGQQEVLAPGQHLVIYTGPGSPVNTFILGTNDPALVVHLGAPVTLFGDPSVHPVVFDVAGAVFPAMA